jgi:uracil-DNA glycosylase
LSDAILRPSGPLDAKIAIVGEAPGEQEAITGRPFEGASGQELTRMLKEAGIERKNCFLTNVFTRRPPNNKLDSWTAKKAEVGTDYQLPPLSSGAYIRPEFLHELDRLRDELLSVKPNIVIALGGTASWALLRAPKITSVRGTVADGSLVPFKVLPSYHPSAILRQWALRPILVTDLIKAERESRYPEIRRPERKVYYDPEFHELAEIEKILLAADILGTDIETAFRTITCIGFAPSPTESYVIPFLDRRKVHGSYWDTPEQEIAAWQMVGRVLAARSVRKLFQNGMYDLQYILRMGLEVHNVSDDTMILHHAMWPELQKSLGFMGSIYTNEGSWKIMRPRGEDSNKREDE